MVLLGNNIYVMTQAIGKKEEPCLPHNLSMINTNTEMTTESRHISVVIKNQTTVLIIIGKDIKVIWVVAVKRVPPVEVRPGTLEKLDEMQRIQPTSMSIECRKEILL